MTAKVLVADDSLTIQKVIGITLASSGHELVECLNEVDLFRFLQSKDFDLVLLDFNLSDKRSGYELSKQIHELCPDLPIMIMLGTFDTVEDSQLAECGIADKVVKPFESGKFIKKCKDLIEKSLIPNAKNREIKISTEPVASKQEDDFTIEDSADSWVVDAPVMQKETGPEEVVEVSHTPLQLDPLASELAGWSVDADVNLEEKYNKVFPSVIEGTNKVNVLERFQESSVFVAEDEVEDEAKDDVRELSHVSTQPAFELPLDLNQQLISEINEDFSPDSFWAVDDIVTIELDDTKQIKETHLDQVVSKPAFMVEDEEEEAIQPSPAAHRKEPINTDEIVEKLKISLRPMIEELVKEYCRQSAEKIAWEVIPDLAENLIRKELKEISESI